MAKTENSASLKELVDNVIRTGRKYYKDGDTDYLPAYHSAGQKLREANKQVYRLVDNCTAFVAYPDSYSYKQIYHVVDYLCGTNLEQENENEK